MDPFILTFTVLSILLGIFIYRISDSGVPKLPPGSFGWPILGETIQFLFEKPETFVTTRMKKHSPEIFKTKILGEKTVVICGPAGHKFLFSNEQKLFTAFRPHAMQALFRSYQTSSTAIAIATAADDQSKVFRQTGFLKPEALTRFVGVIDAITREHFKVYWENKDELKANQVSRILTLTLSFRFFTGTEIEKSPEKIAGLVGYFDDVASGMHSLVLDFPGTVFYRARKAAEAIRREMVAVIREKKAAMERGAVMHDDLLTGMVVSKVAEAEAADKIMGLIVAGYSTVASTITFLMKYVGLNPDVHDKIRLEQMTIASSKNVEECLKWEDIGKMKYSWSVICETMRLVPPLQGTFREALVDFTYAGYTIPKGWKVYWTVSTTNTNPRYFSNPEKFDPSRYDEGMPPIPYTDVPFGGGPRMCPGKEYAKLVILSFLHNVTKRYKWDVLYPNEKVIGHMMPTPEKGLPIRLQAL